jgi:hypothetical protein
MYAGRTDGGDTMKDPIVDEVRQIRLQIEKDCALAGTSYKDHLLAVQKKWEGRLIFPLDERVYAKENSTKYESKQS